MPAVAPEVRSALTRAPVETMFKVSADMHIQALITAFLDVENTVSVHDPYGRVRVMSAGSVRDDRKRKQFTWRCRFTLHHGGSSPLTNRPFGDALQCVAELRRGILGNWYMAKPVAFIEAIIPLVSPEGELLRAGDVAMDVRLVSSAPGLEQAYAKALHEAHDVQQGSVRFTPSFEH